MTSIQPSSWRWGSKSWCSLGCPQGIVPAQYLQHAHVTSQYPHQVFASYFSIPGDVEEEQALEFHLLDFSRQVCSITLRRNQQNTADVADTTAAYENTELPVFLIKPCSLIKAQILFQCSVCPFQLNILQRSDQMYQTGRSVSAQR